MWGDSTDAGKPGSVIDRGRSGGDLGEDGLLSCPRKQTAHSKTDEK
jgi:hypothetical protein